MPVVEKKQDNFVLRKTYLEDPIANTRPKMTALGEQQGAEH